MKSSIMVAAGAAVLAMGSPLEKRKLETTWVVDYTTVTVTGSEEAQPTLLFEAKHRRPDAAVVTPETSIVIVTVYPDAPLPTPTIPEPSIVIVTQTPEADPEPEPEPTTTAQPEPTTAQPVAQAPESPAPEPADDDFSGAAIYHHNIHRSNHSSTDVTWSEKLAGYAAATAATCIMAHDMNQGDGGYGQNLANWAQSSGAAALGATGAVKMAVTDMWYNGEFSKFLPQFYGQATPDMSSFESWGHYSQLLWKSSTELGCASQFCEKGTMYDDFDAWYTVCNYGPAGNVGGAYASNVLQPLGMSTVVV
ncbi:PR-1-like protein [Durotheca rogersii]|uniref:PR-1-like protein n=1 Tax=Durotheca rogersii TaxID=419775 RepID=UPI0022204F5D|nr:PR-1-like protein [Durotheca rogersii]KAI5861105.1 PR-1-like protein [Durotheca rogersii]